MKYRMQIRLWKNTQEKEWVSVKPTHGQPYEYDTKVEAYHTLNMCYPTLTSEDARVIEIQ